MHKYAIIFLMVVAGILVGWFYQSPPEAGVTPQIITRAATRHAVVSQEAVNREPVNKELVNKEPVNQGEHIQEKGILEKNTQETARQKTAYQKNSAIPMAETGDDLIPVDKAVVHSSPSDDRASAASPAQANNSRPDMYQPEQTLEEKQRDWWFSYSRQVPQLLLHGTCPGTRVDQDLNVLKQLADSGDKCAMGNYAITAHGHLSKEFAPYDQEKMHSLRQQLTPLLEYYAVSASAYPLVAGARACAAIIYFNDLEESLAWQMINQAYFSREVYYLLSTCNSFLTPPDNEEAYQRALARALFYVDYYQLDK